MFLIVKSKFFKRFVQRLIELQNICSELIFFNHVIRVGLSSDVVFPNEASGS